MTPRFIRSKRIGLVAAALAVLLTPALLFAHAKLLRSSPAANATLATPPTHLNLWFSERPEVAFSKITLADSAGTAVSLGALYATDSMGVAAPIIGTLAPGKYKLAWRTAAADGHPTNGSFSFTISKQRADSAAAQAPPPAGAQVQITHSTRSANSLVNPDGKITMSSAMRWVELVAVLTLVGIVTFRLAVLPAARWKAAALSDVDDRLRRLANAMFILFIVSTLTRAFTQADLLPFEGSRAATMLALVKNTAWGRGWAIGAAGGIVLLGGLALARRGTAGWITAAVALIAVGLGQTLTGHSAASSHTALAVAADLAHLLAAGGWLGGLAALVVAGLPAVKAMAPKAGSDHGSRLLTAFHGTAVECVTLIVVTALISAWLRLGGFDALWTSRYGITLLLKTAVVILALVLGWYHSKRVVPAAWTGDVAASFRRSAAAELILGMIVLAITAVLVTTPLPR